MVNGSDHPEGWQWYRADNVAHYMAHGRSLCQTRWYESPLLAEVALAKADRCKKCDAAVTLARSKRGG